jgi:hypothetical protein
MSEEFDPLSKKDDLGAENDFLKMKLMLEHGAVIGKMDDSPEVPPEIENQFLKNVAAFEEQWAKVKMITVFEKIGKPTHFKPVNEVAPEEIDASWAELSDYLNSHGLDLNACSPNISKRELYRFTIEELYQHETEDLDIPGMCTCFIYDEFHPDPVYDNTRMVESDLFGDIFSKGDLFCMVHYERKGFVFNGKKYEEVKSFAHLVNSFKEAFDEISLESFTTGSCEIFAEDCLVKGSYHASAISGKRPVDFQGEFEVKLRKGDLGYWYFVDILIRGFNPQ